MNNEERDMIAGLFDRMRETGLAERDRDAEKLIAQYVRQMPDAPYMLVQTVLIQEHALGEAEARIRDLEQQLAAQQPPRAASGSGSFLGGLRGGRGAPAASSSVPSTGGRRMAEPEPGYGGSPWGAPAGQPQQMPPQQAPQPSSGGGFGGFMRGALTTAAGVAGGMMIGDALRGMMGGSSSPFGGSQGHSSTSGSPLPAPGDKPHYQDASSNDPGADYTQDASQEEQLDPDDWTIDDSTEV